jgi:hypothetical protein
MEMIPEVYKMVVIGQRRTHLRHMRQDCAEKPGTSAGQG